MKIIFSILVGVIFGINTGHCKKQSVLDFKIDSLTAKVDSLREQATTIKSQIESIESQLKDLQRLQIVSQGDSLLAVTCAVSHGCAIMDRPVFSGEVIATAFQGAMMGAYRFSFSSEYVKVVYEDFTGYVFVNVLEKSPELKTIKNGGLPSNGPTYGVETPKNETKSTTSGPSYRGIQTGPRGGQYYINSHGHKTYVKKPGKP